MPYLSIDFVQKLLRAYEAVCKPLCRRLQLPQTAFDILMFLSNNPQYPTAGDIVRLRGIGANLASVNVDRLAREGYLLRREAPGDRRKSILTCTEKAEPIVLQGRQLQEAFRERLFAGVSGADREAFCRVIEAMGENLNKITKEGLL